MLVIIFAALLFAAVVWHYKSLRKLGAPNGYSIKLMIIEAIISLVAGYAFFKGANVANPRLLSVVIYSVVIPLGFFWVVLLRKEKLKGCVPQTMFFIVVWFIGFTATFAWEVKNQDSAATNAEYVSQYASDTYTTPNGKQVTISFIKHGTLMFNIDGQIVHIDPVAMFGTDYTKMPKADVVLVTHEHPDHLDTTAIAAVTKADTKFYSNGRVAEITGKSTAMSIGDSVQFNGFSVTAVAAYNNTPGHENFHPKGRDVGYIINADGFRIYVAGDTESIDEMNNLGRIDIAFLPVNQPYTMNPDQCITALEMINPTVAYPYHYGETNLDPIIEHFFKTDSIKIEVREMQ